MLKVHLNPIDCAVCFFPVVFCFVFVKESIINDHAQPQQPKMHKKYQQQQLTQTKPNQTKSMIMCFKCAKDHTCSCIAHSQSEKSVSCKQHMTQNVRRTTQHSALLIFE